MHLKIVSMLARLDKTQLSCNLTLMKINLRYWIEAVSLPFIAYLVFLSFTEFVHESFSVLSDFQVTIAALMLSLISVYIWNYTLLSRFVPCRHDNAAHNTSRFNLVIIGIVFVVHLFVDILLFHDHGDVGQVAEVLHRLTDVFVLLVLLNNWSHYITKGVFNFRGVKVGLWQVFLVLGFVLTTILSGIHLEAVESLLDVESVHVWVGLLTGFFLSMFLHPPHKSH